MCGAAPGWRKEGSPGGGRGHPDEPCRNCGDPSPADFCPSCGQRKVEVRVSVATLVGDLMEDQFGVERRLPATLFALFLRPGLLTREYLDGRVVRYVRPFKLYLVSSLVLFLLVGLLSLRGVSALNLGPDGTALQFTPEAGLVSREASDALRTAREAERAARAGREPGPAAAERAMTIPDTIAPGEEETPWYERVQVNTGNERLDALVRARMQRLGRMDPRDAIREVTRTFLNYLPTLLFLLLPVFAGILKLLYIRSGRFYVEHFVFVLHTHAFIFGIFTLSLLAGLAGVGFLPGLLLLWAAAYLYLALRRVYGQGHLWTAVKYWSLGWMYFWTLVVALPPMVILTLLLAGG
jgi:hypothetical protein